MSTSTNQLTAVEELLRDVRELTMVRPHVPADARFTPGAYRAYCEGYYMALVMALRVMDFALVRRRMRRELAARTAQVITQPAVTSRARVLNFSRSNP